LPIYRSIVSGSMNEHTSIFFDDNQSLTFP
jgi:hypothetical protein